MTSSKCSLLWWCSLRGKITSVRAWKLLYGGIRTLYFGIGAIVGVATEGHPYKQFLWGGEFFGHADEVGEGSGMHLFHDLAAVKLDGDFARA